jgi:tellurite resistance protein
VVKSNTLVAAYCGFIFSASENRMTRVVRKRKKVQVVNTSKVSKVFYYYCPKNLSKFMKQKVMANHQQHG